MNDHKGAYQSLPGVDKLLASSPLQPLLAMHGKALVTHCIRESISYFRKTISQGSSPPDQEQIIQHISLLISLYGTRHLKRVINATGIIIHTNLGRAPYGEQMLKETFEVLAGYSNLEFDLESATRGHRNDHARELLKFLTGAEEVLVVNNAAAAVMMILRCFAKNREVIVSRGELIEIGGSFRFPDIMAASDCRMVEVGTTNKTRLSDYEKAITDHTALLFKAHKSNYIIKGFTEEVSAEELSAMGHKRGIPVLYDLGSGLLRKVNHPALQYEPDVREALATGVGLVCFSGDKLLGGPQAGIIAGKKELVDKLMQEPMLRALRVCKTTLALLETACSYYLSDDTLFSKNLLFKTFNKNKTQLLHQAETLRNLLKEKGIEAEVVESTGQCGGGTLPDAEIESYAVQIVTPTGIKDPQRFPRELYRTLLLQQIPVLGVLRKGNLLFDVLTLEEGELTAVAEVIANACNVNYS
jgi:L-seryl-tRNA(Ser) seleniumtransferase